MGRAKVNEGYELYQIISDFGNPLEIFREALQNSFDENASKIFVNVYEQAELGGNKLIIDILDNGDGLAEEKVSSFYDTANSTKIDENYISTGKHGYKGHGSKVYFNAEKVTICSKTKNGKQWLSELDKPLDQISKNKVLEYSDPRAPKTGDVLLPDDWESGFRVRIIAPRLFANQQTRSYLEHIYLRDYCKWYSIFGTVETLYNDKLKNKDVVLYLSGLNISSFKDKYNSIEACDPIPEFQDNYEKISLGHYFPEERRRDSDMKNYVKKINSNKYWYDYYSRMVFNGEVNKGGFSFRLIINIEGYETKRKYDLLLSKKGIASTELNHTDASRYGLWACKGGVPIEKIDDWIEGGRGVGTYTYMQAFVDCDRFQLTANRGSIRNTDIDVLNIIKEGINEVLKSKDVERAIKEREEIENLEKTILSIQDDEKDLKKRYNDAGKRKTITLPNGSTILEPSKNGKSYNESETFALLVALITNYPDLFDFQLLDYNTTKGIDFVVDVNGSPKYIELKGTLTKKMNHPFKLIYKFIAYNIDVKPDDVVEDIDEYHTKLIVNKNDTFRSFDSKFQKNYTSYVLMPQEAAIQSMEIINLKTFLIEVVGATIS